MINPILYWNDALLEANARDHTGAEVVKAVPTRGPTGSSRAFAMVHLAMRDAVVAVRGTKPTYTGVTYVGPSTDEARDAAVAAAAQCTLAALWPEHEDYFTAHAAGHVMTGGGGMDAGHRVGVEIASALLADRATDGADDRAHYASSAAYGRHRVDPANPGQPFLGPQWGSVRHFVLQPPDGHVALDPPPGYALADYLDDPHYKADHDEVRSDGALHSTTRTPDQTVVGHYWAYDGVSGLGTPPRLYNQVLRAIVANRGTPVDDQAELFAQANVAMADAGVEAWYWKYYYNLWRPVIGIREASANDGPSGVAGANTTPDCDPFWLPHGAPNSNQTSRPDFTPPFPAYPSGHATFGAAMLGTIRLFFGGAPITVAEVLSPSPAADPDNAFDLVSGEMDGVSTSANGHLRPRHVRRFTELATPIRENALSRVYLGVHWRFDGVPRTAGDNIGGVPLGLRVARRVHARGLVPLG